MSNHRPTTALTDRIRAAVGCPYCGAPVGRACQRTAGVTTQKYRQGDRITTPMHKARYAVYRRSRPELQGFIDPQRGFIAGDGI